MPTKYSKKKDEDEDSVDKKAKEYIKDNPDVDYRDAIVLVSMEER